MTQDEIARRLREEIARECEEFDRLPEDEDPRYVHYCNGRLCGLDRALTIVLGNAVSK